MGTVVLEPASGRSAAELAALFTASYEGYFMPVTVDEAGYRFMAGSWDFDLDASRIALDGEEPVGICNVGVRGEDGWIGGIGIIAGRRGEGIGKQLMRAAEEEARARGLKRIWLEVLVQNAPAIALYEKLGYERVRELEVWSLNELVFQKGQARSVPVEQTQQRIRTERAEREPWQRSDETVANVDNVEALESGRGAVLFRRTGERISLLQAAAADETAACELLHSFPGRCHLNELAERAYGRPVQRSDRGARRHTIRAPARAGARALARASSHPSDRFGRETTQIAHLPILFALRYGAVRAESGRIHPGEGEHVKRSVIALAVVVFAAVAPATALADDDHGQGAAYGHDKIKNGDHIDVGDDAAARGKLKVSKKDAPTQAQLEATTAVAASALQSPPIGAQRIWPLVNFVTGGTRFETFTLRSVGAHTEVWVSNTLNFPAGDCRNDGQRNVVTTDQTNYLTSEFDAKMYPIESQYFSTPPSREGANATLYTLLPANFPSGYFAGPGDKVVTLVANIRDENFATITFPSYVGGYHSSGINAFVDRNVMTIDSYDWFHRTGANPPNEPSTVLCDNKPARPFSYEATFAHEYQHLLEFWASPGERTWVNEGLSEFAMGLLGYAATEKTIDELGWDGHIQTFLGWRLKQTPFNQIPQPNGGPENSLTVWDDQGSLETLADYGATFTFHELLAHRYGSPFMSDLHNEDVNGIPGLQKVLDKYLTGKTAQELFHEWAAMVALDRSLDDGANLRGRARQADYQVGSLHSAIYWENPQAYSTTGSPPNGSDHVALRDGGGTFLKAADVRSLEFKGAKVHALLPVTWLVDPNPPAHTGNPALQSAAANNLNRLILRDVAVPAGPVSLTFETRYGLEDQWDYAYVQVSTDNGQTWTSLANANTTTSHDPGANPNIVAQLPGFTGDADWHTETFDLSTYAGQNVLLAFRNMTDTNTLGNGGAIGAGVWVDNVAVNGQLISDGSSVEGWRAEVAAPAVHGFTVQLVGISSTGATASILAQIPLDANFRTSLSGGALRRLIGDEVDLVGAIVTYDEPTEAINRYAPYELTANGFVQPGG